jgi:hypothetical protein
MHFSKSPFKSTENRNITERHKKSTGLWEFFSVLELIIDFSNINIVIFLKNTRNQVGGGDILI